MKIFLLSIFLFVLYTIISTEIVFKETFDDGDLWEKRWVQSNYRSDLGVLKRDQGDWYGSTDNYGAKTSQDARFYALSSEFEKEFSNEGKTLVIQFSVKFPQGIDCGGGYLKYLPSSLNQQDFKGDSKYYIMFGPDICGSTKKVHLIFHYKGKNLDWKKSITAESDKLTHLYTAIIRSDLTYEVQVDGVKKESGKLVEDWDFLPPKKIPDPNAKKPADWVDEKEIPDPEDKKPEGFDQPKTIPDPNAKKPDDWDEEEDGKWEAPQIPNLEYKGDWKPKMIANPAYKGEWKAQEIDNPEYFSDDKLHIFPDMKFVGIDIWQVKSGTTFDNILVADSESEAKQEADKVLDEMKKEKQMYDRIEEEKRKKEDEERKKREEEEKKKREEEEKKKSKEEEKKKSEEEEEKKEEEAELTKKAEEAAEQLKKVVEESEKNEEKDEL